MSDKKRILIISHAMELGGAERSLLGLLDAIDTKKIDVELFLLRHSGELLKYIPKQITLLPEIPTYTVYERPIIDVVKEGHFLMAMGRIVGRYAAQRYTKKHKLISSAVAIEYSHKYTRKILQQICSEKEYDLAISFLTPHYIVAEKVRAKRKIAWIHTDYQSIDIDQESELKMWEKMDYIMSISEAVTESFIKTFPTLKKKLVLFENILPKKLIEEQAIEFLVNQEMPDDEVVKVLSIGRFCEAKNFDNVPYICKQIREQGVNIKWYLLGYGRDEGLIRQKIKENQMEKYVIMLGKRDNPYPYIKACDVYIQPSRYEGKCVAVREAQMLGKPVIITNYATASSQLEDGVDGIIVPMDNQKCAAGIVEVLKDVKRQKQLIKNCKLRDYSNAQEIEKLYNIIF